MAYRLGVDVGGTFTDFLLMNEESGETRTAKILSTPEDSSIGVLNGIAKICDIPLDQDLLAGKGVRWSIDLANDQIG